MISAREAMDEILPSTSYCLADENEGGQPVSVAVQEVDEGLSSSSGPVTGPSTIIAGDAVATANGDLILTAAGDATFEAVAAVPEPATVVSASLACLIGLGYAWLRRKRAAA